MIKAWTLLSLSARNNFIQLVLNKLYLLVSCIIGRKPTFSQFGRLNWYCLILVYDPINFHESGLLFKAQNLLFLCAVTHIDNYDDSEIDRVAEIRVTDIF